LRCFGVNRSSRNRRLAALLPLALGLALSMTGSLLQPAQAEPREQVQPASDAHCTSPTQVRPLALPANALAPAAAAPAADGSDYRHLLQPTPAGWPILDHWCVWIEPANAEAGTAEAQRQATWSSAVETALQQWAGLLKISLVSHPDQAQVRLWRRRPPLQRLADGRQRASHGRAVLSLVAAQRQQQWWAEPRIDVLLDPGRAPLPLQATALHELGHAFGLWAHSDHPDDAMAAKPGARPVLQLSRRDRATLLWLLRQSNRMPTAATPAETPAAAPTPPQARKAD
jgi:predicted Zn-dependent protease